mmetsp:Transcript_18165/g.51981  ORF Transcript_18165/g.51981 Transcript_18165/m.51981 type:complete len:211 (-) Transcript_18165:495-1127(-)
MDPLSNPSTTPSMVRWTSPSNALDVTPSSASSKLWRISTSHRSASTSINRSMRAAAGFGPCFSSSASTSSAVACDLPLTAAPTLACRTARARRISAPAYSCSTFWRMPTIPSMPSWCDLFIHASTVERKPSSRAAGSNLPSASRMALTRSALRGTMNSPLSGSAAALTTVSTSLARSSSRSSMVLTTAWMVWTRFSDSAMSLAFTSASVS